MNDPKVAEFIIETAQKRPTTLGSHLGAELIKAFPELRGNPAYPGLKRFIQTNCAGRVVRVGDHGGDDVYQCVAEGDAPPPAAVPPTIPTAWDVFQRPGAEGRLAVNPATGELRVALNEQASLGDFAVIASVTPAEHRTIAQGFVEKVDPVSRLELEQALAQENYWPHWSRLVNQKGVYKQDWVTFRFERLCEVFRARLRAHGMNDALIGTGMEHLLQEKRERERPLKEIAASLTSARSPLSGRKQPSSADIRAMVHAAVDSMGENELRRLWLPLGDVLDALRLPRH